MSQERKLNLSNYKSVTASLENYDWGAMILLVLRNVELITKVTGVF